MPAIQLLICDDSNMARKQLLRALPTDWPVNVTQAVNGQEGLDAIRKGLGQVVLLDLTMPEMDGYQVLAQMRAEGLKAKVIVVSGDVQDEAVRRVLDLGAEAFLKKPADPEELLPILKRLGVMGTVSGGGAPIPGSDVPILFFDAFRETVNVAMGQAAALLAKVLGVFVQLPVPSVNLLEVNELHMVLTHAESSSNQRLTAICQGFIGSGIAGEALLMFHDSDVGDMARLMQMQHTDESSMEALMDLSSVLIGACLSGLADQLDVVFSQGHPQFLGAHGNVEALIDVSKQRWTKTLTVEISYSLEGHAIHFDLLLLFTEDSVDLLQNKLAYLMN